VVRSKNSIKRGLNNPFHLFNSQSAIVICFLLKLPEEKD